MAKPLTVPKSTSGAVKPLFVGDARRVWPPVNDSGLQPLEYRVLILLDKVKEYSKGGIMLPPEVTERKQMATTRATVIACGGKSCEDWPEADKLKAGDRVLVKKYAGETTADVAGSDGEEYRLCQDKEVLARLA